jgi:thiamine biosynthesis lipoprotein ApbE
VSVIDTDTARTDALATALMVMGSKKGAKFCEQHRITCYFIDGQDGSFNSIASPEFKKHLIN